MDEHLQHHIDAGIATIIFNRPKVLNALTFDVYARFRDLLAALKGDNAIKAVIVTGAGNAFCAGGDVHEIIGKLLDRDMREHLEFARMTGAVVRNMRELDKPIIAAVNGIAAGAGAVIALAADLRIVSEQARFAFLFSKVGLTGADMGAAYLLPRVVGTGRAMQLLLLGETIDATTAENYGLANRLVKHDELMIAAREWADRLASGPTLALSMTKTMVNNEWSMDLASAIESEAQAQALMLMGDDHRRFYEAFAGRKPAAPISTD
ncbi:MAG TPA: enoyl-CoA hydratase family protein [Blastocatellia bacterium]